MTHTINAFDLHKLTQGTSKLMNGINRELQGFKLLPSGNIIYKCRLFTPAMMLEVRDWLKQLTFGDIEDTNEVIDEATDELCLSVAFREMGNDIEEVINLTKYYPAA